MTRLGSIRQTWLCRVLAQHPLVPLQSLHVNSDPYHSVILAHVSSFTGHRASRTHTRKCTPRVHTHALHSLMLTFLIHTPVHTLISASNILSSPHPSTLNMSNCPSCPLAERHLLERRLPRFAEAKWSFGAVPIYTSHSPLQPESHGVCH